MSLNLINGDIHWDHTFDNIFNDVPVLFLNY